MTETVERTRKSRAAVAQPASVMTVPDALLNVETVKMLTGFSKNTIYRLMATGDFPDAIRLGTRTTRWRAGTISAWLAARGG